MTTSLSEAEITASCLDCGWGAEGRKAWGDGREHANETGHKVVCLMNLTVIFNDHPED